MNRLLLTIALALGATLTAAALGDTVRPLADPDPFVRKTLRVRVTNVHLAAGTIWVGVYESADDFLDREKALLVPVRVTALGDAYVDIPNLIVGEDYALGIFHDLDDNGEFDTNWLGLPAEPWAFSGRLASRLRLPRFEEVSFVFKGEKTVPPLRLRTWL
jgi:uncharacterized protein (DUF2141 family)